MNVFIFIMLLFALLGLLDKLLHNRFGLEAAFDKGLYNMGSIALSMSGCYCIAIALIQQHSDVVTSLSASAFDPAIVIGSILAPDLGGYSIISQLPCSPSMMIFAGVLLTSTIGATISFQFPIFLTALDQKDVAPFMKGIMIGIITLPVILILSAWYLHLEHMWIQLCPIIVLCVILCVAMLISFQKTIRLLCLFAGGIRILSLIFFGMVILSLFFDVSFTTPQLIQEVMVITLRMSIIVCGSMVLCDIVMKKGKHYIQKISRLFGMNEEAIMGLLLSLGTSIAMIPLFSKMDEKGKIVNAAFSVSGAYVLGGQLGFIASLCDPDTTSLYMIVKLTAGLLAIAIVLLLYRNTQQQ